MEKDIETILLVEDDEQLRKMNKLILSTKKYNVITADNGLSGLKAYKSNKDDIDLVLSDYEMPGINGIQLTEMIKRIKEVGVIIYSGNPDIEQEALDVADAFIAKPYFPFDLFLTISDVLDEYRK